MIAGVPGWDGRGLSQRDQVTQTGLDQTASSGSPSSAPGVSRNART